MANQVHGKMADHFKFLISHSVSEHVWCTCGACVVHVWGCVNAAE